MSGVHAPDSPISSVFIFHKQQFCKSVCSSETLIAFAGKQKKILHNKDKRKTLLCGATHTSTENGCQNCTINSVHVTPLSCGIIDFLQNILNCKLQN